MWPKKTKESSEIKVHKLEIEKLKLESALKAEKNGSMVSTVLLIMVLLFLFVCWV